MEAIRNALTDEQKDELDRILDDSRQEGREEAKAALRSTIAGSKKPEAFDPTSETLAQFLKRWEPFSKAMVLSDASSIITLVTYLDKETQVTVGERRLDTLEKWDEFKTPLLIAVRAPAGRLKSRQLLLNTQQEIGKNTSAFVKRLKENVLKVHGPQLSPEMEEIAKDILIKGLKDRNLRKDIIKQPTWSFTMAVEYVKNMAATDEVLDLKSDKQDVEVNIMQVNKDSYSRQMQGKGKETNDKKCFFCGKTRHVKRDCYRYRGSSSYRSNFNKSNFPNKYDNNNRNFSRYPYRGTFAPAMMNSNNNRGYQQRYNQRYDYLPPQVKTNKDQYVPV